jgi:hypothetical protein
MWKVTWNPKFYDYKRLINDYRNNGHCGFIKQSKGMAKMRVVPQIDDEVCISCAKLKIMKCKVVSGFVENEQGIRDEYEIGDTSRYLHTQNNTFLMLQILEVYDRPERMTGLQRTWAKYQEK